jgi:hypothetical protein
MKTQLVQDHNGKPTGVFIPIKDWELIKKKFPSIEKIDEDIPQWHKAILDERLNDKKEPIDALQMVENIENNDKI